MSDVEETTDEATGERNSPNAGLERENWRDLTITQTIYNRFVVGQKQAAEEDVRNDKLYLRKAFNVQGEGGLVGAQVGAVLDALEANPDFVTEHEVEDAAEIIETMATAYFDYKEEVSATHGERLREAAEKRRGTKLTIGASAAAPAEKAKAPAKKRAAKRRAPKQ